MTVTTKVRSALLATTTLVLLSGCTDNGKLAELAKREQLEKAHLETFDDLDFNVFSGQKWDQLWKSHAEDVIVHWPDGRTTTGIDVHIADLEALFVFSPDTRIQEHPIRIASGEWTAVTSIFEGTFTNPMPIGDGSTIPPTGKPFKLLIATIGHWENGVMKEEWLFWDSQTLMKQIGLAE